MSNIKEYDCPNCGGSLTFDPPSEGWKCGYCFSAFNKEEIDKIYGTTESEQLDEEALELDTYHCDSCGAELIADDTTSATFCLYCKSPTVIKQRFKGSFQPKYAIPFKLTKEQSVDIYKKWINKKLFAPTSFKLDDEIDKLTGIYAPFWLFDCDAHGATTGSGTIVTSWRSGKYQYTKTKHYHVEREGNVRYEKIPVDASTKLDDKFMTMLEPYDYKEIKDFSMAYLTGFMAEKYDVESTESEKVMKERAEEFVSKRLRETINGYSTYVASSNSAQLHDVLNNYALMPIYLLVNQYKDEKHMFLINGQTGKVVGETPIDHTRQAIFFGVVSACVWVITVLGGAIFG
jgi:DNA-directed RNA polymerase subunit RPC12/RpoP